MTASTSDDARGLASLLWESHIKRSGRKPALMAIHASKGRSRVTSLDLSLRMRARGHRWLPDRVQLALEALGRKGVVLHGEGGWAVATWERVAEVAGVSA
jgi:hypothetical protein